MPHYIALVHKDADSCYGVSFPDVLGVFTAGDTIDELRRDPQFQADAVEAVIVAVPFRVKTDAAA